MLPRRAAALAQPARHHQLVPQRAVRDDWSGVPGGGPAAAWSLVDTCPHTRDCSDHRTGDRVCIDCGLVLVEWLLGGGGGVRAGDVLAESDDCEYDHGFLAVEEEREGVWRR